LRMSTPKLLTFALLLGTTGVYTQSPDNTANNKGNTPTADQQKMNKADRDMTAQIRKSIIADKSLSTYGHNVKIITQDGMVTLKGPVRSDDEAKNIAAKAAEVAGGSDKVMNQLEVKPK